MSTTREQAGPSKPWDSTADEKEKDNRTFECNICLDTAKNAVISMCGHLFCWPCLHQWLETRPTRQMCPVCKAAISKDKVIPLYGRGDTRHEDPRNNVPPRPAGQRTEPENNIGFSSFGFGDGSYMSFGIGTFPFAFFTSTFNFGETRPSAVSNEVPEHPVVSPVSGSIFEKRLIEKYLAENGVDPITGKELTVDQLIDIKTTAIVKPKPPSATSIPAILKILQDEWDAVMLHSFTLRQQLQTARQELSHSLYQHDAACRVIARLTKEVTAAREALATLKPQAGIVQATTIPQPALAVEAGGTAAQPMEQAGITEDVIQKLQERATVLTQERKRRGRSVPEDLLPQDSIRAFQTLASHPGLHSASVPGILALDIHSADTSKILTGGADKNATVFNKDTEQVVAILKGHTKKVTRVIYHPEEDIVMTASPDTTIRVWNVGTSQTTLLLKGHDAPVTGLSLHPTGDYLLSSSLDQHWAFSDIRTGRLLTKVAGQVSQPLTTAQFHPDGLIFGTGTQDSQVKIWDLKEQSNVANFPGHSGPITAISFSENGYYLATAAEDSCVKLWDLRKLKNFKTLQLEEAYEVKDICFDQSGTYLAVAGTDVRVYLCKQWQELKVLNDHTAAATGVRFGKHAQYIASTSMDRTLKLYGLP